jgi:NADH:ubiquinone oxidoreductase subunit 3 (subunit A)
MNDFEPDIRDYLRKVLKTVSVGLVFLLFHMTVGIFLNWAFFEGSMGIGNMVYYLVLVTTLAGMINYLIRVWKRE